MEATKEPGLTDYSAALRRRRWLMIGIGLPILATAVILFGALPTVYRSIAVFRFETPAVQDLQNGNADARNNYLDEYVSKLQDTVLGAASLAKLDSALHLSPNEGGAPAIEPKRIHVDITTQRILDPDSARQKDVNSGFNVYYDSPSAQQAQQVSQWLADQFLNQSRQNRHDRAMQAATFLQAEANKYRDTASNLESRLADFKQKHAGELPESANVTAGEKERAEMDSSNVEQELTALRQNRMFLQTQLQQSQTVNPDSDALRQLQDEYSRKLATYDPSHPDMIALKGQIDQLQRGSGVLAGDSLQAQLQTLRSVLAQTRQRYSEEHPDVKRLERSIAALQARIDAGEKSPITNAITNPAVVQLQTQLNANESQTAALMERRANLNAKLATIASQISASPQVEKQYTAMVNELALAREKYDELLKRRMDSETSAAGALAGSGDEFLLLSAPGSAASVNRSKFAIGIIGAVLAVILSIGAALLAEFFDQTVRGSNDVLAILNMVPLATVPEIRNSRYASMHKRRLIRFALLAIVGAPLLYEVIHLTVA